MKQILLRIIPFTLIFCLIFSFGACAPEEKETRTLEPAVSATDGNTIPAQGLWKEAIYRKNRDFGEGDNTVHVEVEAEGKTVSFTIYTYKDNLAEILQEHHLVEGEEAAYGLYVKKVNGITADYDVNGSYWALLENGESSMTGVSGVTVEDGGTYRFVYTK